VEQSVKTDNSFVPGDDNCVNIKLGQYAGSRVSLPYNFNKLDSNLNKHRALDIIACMLNLRTQHNEVPDITEIREKQTDTNQWEIAAYGYTEITAVDFNKMLLCDHASSVSHKTNMTSLCQNHACNYRKGALVVLMKSLSDPVVKRVPAIAVPVSVSGSDNQPKKKKQMLTRRHTLRSHSDVDSDSNSNSELNAKKQAVRTRKRIATVSTRSRTSRTRKKLAIKTPIHKLPRKKRRIQTKRVSQKSIPSELIIPRNEPTTMPSVTPQRSWMMKAVDFAFGVNASSVVPL
jgi:hypothetical protein